MEGVQPHTSQIRTQSKRNFDPAEHAKRDTSQPKSPRIGKEQEETRRQLKQENEELRERNAEYQRRLSASGREA